MIAKAQWKYLGTSAQKVRLVVDQIRGKQVEKALSILRFSPKMAARDVAKVLKSAVANAEQREERIDVDHLTVSRAYVDEGPIAKRARFRAMGRIFRINKRSCHVTLELDLDARGRAAAKAVESPGKPARARRKPAAPARKTGTTAKKAAAGKKATAGKKAAPKKKKAAAARSSTKKTAPAGAKKKAGKTAASRKKKTK